MKKFANLILVYVLCLATVAACLLSRGTISAVSHKTPLAFTVLMIIIFCIAGALMGSEDTDIE